MHLGLTPWDFSNRSAQSLARQAQLAESLGYESFWLPESHFTPAAIPDPLMLLASVAAATERIHLGSTSYLLPMRNPLLAAEQVAVLDQLSQGRVILGVGRGYAANILRAFDVAPREKRARFEANLKVMMQAWSGAPINAANADQAPVVLNPLPVQRPHPPVWVAAFGPKALAQAGRLGLPYLGSPMETLATLKANLRRHGQAAADAGHAPLDVLPLMRSVFVGRSRREIQAVRDSLRSAGRPRPDADTEVDDWAIVGDRAYVADKFAQYREALAPSHLVVTRLRIGGIAETRLVESITEVMSALR